MAKKKKGGWFREPVRHGLSARGVKTAASPEPKYVDPIPKTKYGGWWWKQSEVEKAMLERFRRGQPPVSNMSDVVEYIDTFERSHQWEDPVLGATTNERLGKVKLKLKRGQRLSDDELELVDWVLHASGSVSRESSSAPQGKPSAPANKPVSGKASTGKRGPKFKTTDDAWQAAQSELAERYGGGTQVGAAEGDESLKSKMGKGAF